jgi:hypothetical protein
MKCPYCCSEIPDDALVCKFCQRDVAFLRPFLAEMVELRSSVQAHEVAIQSLANELSALPMNTPAEALRYPRAPRAWVLVALGVGLEIVLYALARQAHLLSRTFFILMTANPFPLGLWYGRSIAGRQVRRYLLIGAVMALLGLLGTIGYWWVDDKQITLPSTDDLYSFAILIVGPTLIFTMGALFGDWLKDIANGRSTHRIATRIADVLIRKDRNPVASTRAGRVAKLASVITALGPLLTFLATLATGYFTYLATVNKARDEKASSSSVHAAPREPNAVQQDPQSGTQRQVQPKGPAPNTEP